MNEEIKNDEIISELLHISTLYSSQQSLSRKLALLSGEQSREKERLFDRTEENLRAFQKDQLNSFSATKPSIPSACISMPPPPPPKMEHPEKTEKKILIGSLLGLGLLAVFPIMFIAVALESAEILPKLAEFLNSIYVLMGAGCFVGWCLYGHFAITEVVEWEKKQTAWEAALADWEDAFNKNCSVS